MLPCDDTAEIDCSNCSVLATPLRAISSLVTICTGSAVSASMRRIDDPVISTRCASCASASDVTARPLTASAAARPTLLLLNMSTPQADNGCSVDLGPSRQPDRPDEGR